MNKNTKRLMALSILLTSGIHQRLSQVQAQEIASPIATSQNLSSSVTNESLTSPSSDAINTDVLTQADLQNQTTTSETAPSSSTDAVEQALPSETITETNLPSQPELGSVQTSATNQATNSATQSSSIVPPTTSATTQQAPSTQPLQLKDVEAEIANAIIQRVNDLRVLNGLNKLEKNQSLEEAANTLVNQHPISEDFIAKNGGVHNLDTTTAKEAGFQSDYVPANHLYTEYTLENLQNLDLKTLASDFVNKWYLDLADTQKLHRQQMLTKDWTQTGVGVDILPKVMVGDYSNEYLKSKFGDTVATKTIVELLDGFQIHVTQYFGNQDKSATNSTVGLNQSVSLENYESFIKNQVGKEELNPNTGIKVLLDSQTANQEIALQSKINQTHGTELQDLINKPLEIAGPFSEETLMAHLKLTREPLNEGSLTEQLKSQILEKLQQDQSGTDIKVVELTKNQSTLSQWKLVNQNGQKDLIPLSTNQSQTRPADKQFSMTPSNIFNSRDEAIQYGQQMLADKPNYYFSLAKMADGKYSVWFTEKMVLRQDTKYILEHEALYKRYAEDLIQDLAKMYVDFTAEVYVRPDQRSAQDYDRDGIVDTLYGIRINPSTPTQDLGLSLPETDAWMSLYKPLGKGEQDMVFEEADGLVSTHTLSVSLPWDAKYVPLYYSEGSMASNYYSNGIIEQHFINQDILNNPYYKSYELAKQAANSSGLTSNYKIIRMPLGYTYINTNKQNTNIPERTNVYLATNPNTLANSIDNYANYYKLRYDIFELGGLYMATLYPESMPNPANESYFDDKDKAIIAAQEYLSSHPDTYYDIFRVDDKYIVRYANNRLETRWVPDAMFFQNDSEADQFANFISKQVRTYDYEVVPDRYGFYKIKTNCIVYFDDQDGLLLIPQYLSSGNSGILGQDTGYGTQLADVYAKFRRQAVGNTDPQPTPGPIDDLNLWNEDGAGSDNAWNYLPNTPIVSAVENIQTNSPVVGASQAQAAILQNLGLSMTGLSSNQADQQDLMMRRIRLVMKESNLNQWINFLLTNLFAPDQTSHDHLKEAFDLLYQLEVLFKDSTQTEFAEPVPVEVVLFQGEEVDQVVEMNPSTNEELGTIGFQVEERPLNQVLEDFPQLEKELSGYDKVQVLTFQLKQANNFAVKFKK